MEAMLIIGVIILIIITSLIILIINKIFSRYKLLLCCFYSSLVLFFLCVYIMAWRQLDLINSMVVPLTANTGNSVEFTFTPNYTGHYSMDLAFFNESTNQYYQLCEFPWEKGDKTKCGNSIIYRTIKWSANDQTFSGKNSPFGTVSKEDWKSNKFHYGHTNYAMNGKGGTSLRFYEFKGKRDLPIQFNVQIDATQEEILSSQASIIVGADPYKEEIPLRQMTVTFIAISLPLLAVIANILWNRFRGIIYRF